MKEISMDWDSPGGPVAKTSPSNAGGMGLTLVQGARSQCFVAISIKAKA